jgi:hypothetical protein
MALNNLQLDSMNESQLWNFFRQEVSEEECPEDYHKIFSGTKILFEIVRYFNSEGIHTIKDGTEIVIKRPKRIFSRWEFEKEISCRMQLMKEILEEKFRKEPIAKTRILKNVKNEQ